MKKVVPLPDDKEIQKLFNQWRVDSLKFANEVFDWDKLQLSIDGKIIRGLSKQQIEGLEWINKLVKAKLKKAHGEKMTQEEQKLASKKGISIRSGHGVGKDFWLAVVFLWFIFNFWYARGLVTAPTASQLRDILWGNLSTMINASPLLKENIELQSELMFFKGKKADWFIRGRTANIAGSQEEQGEALSGTHGEFMILAVDEASGVPMGVFKPIEATMTGAMNFAILIGNPTRSSGYFFNTHHEDRERWICLHWNSEESELVSKQVLEDDIKKYGKDSNWYRVRRLGDFPITDAEKFLIPYEWVLDAVNREIMPLDNDPILKGIDIGGGVDKTVIATRRGKKVLPFSEYNNPDTTLIMSWIMGELADDPDYDFVFVDPIGYGANVYWQLREQKIKGLMAVDVRQASSDSNYEKLRDELFWRLREDFEKRLISIPDDDELKGELISIRYDDESKSTGAIKIESKRKMRARGLQSPNKADALAFTYYFGDSTYKAVGKDIKFKGNKQQTVSWKVV